MVLIVFLIMSTTVALFVQPAYGETCKRRVCLFHSIEQNYVRQDIKIVPEDIDVSLCTHIAYKGASYDSSKEFPVITNNEAELEKIVGMKATNPSLKVLLFLVEYECKENQNVQIASTESNRNMFANNMVKYIRDYQFDGLVYGCTFFGPAPTDPQVTKVLTNIIIGLNQAFTQEATGSNSLELVLYTFGERIFDTYEIAELSTNVDWIILDATYLQGYWNGVTGHHSPLYSNYDNQGVNPQYSVDTAVKLWIDEGAPRDKLVISLPAFGLQFTLTSSESGVGAPASAGINGFFPRVSYFEICVRFPYGVVRRHFIHKQRVPYLVDLNQWFGYDDAGSLKTKVRYIKEQNLGGFYFESLQYDDPMGKFCGRGPYPLLKAINDECLA